MRLTILTLGSRGDVQPFVALGLRLKASGYDVRVCASARFERFITSRGLGYAHMSDDLLRLVLSKDGRRAVERGGRSFSLLLRAMPLLQGNLREQWEACLGSDAIISHPYALGGTHIAERLGLPCVVAAPLPVVTPTAAFPSPLLAQTSLGRPVNQLTHVIVGAVLETLLWLLRRASRRQLPALASGPPPDPGALPPGARGTTLVLYAYSSHLIADPPDWPDTTRTTGYWLLERDDDTVPSVALERFIASGPPPLYVGFGSMLVSDPERLTRMVLEALDRTGQRAVLAAGWGALSASAIDFPGTVFPVETVPHRWLFPRVSAVVHHGGAGTTAAGLRAGRPTLICPFVGDQAFWGRRVHELGVGPQPLPYKKMTIPALASRITELTRPGPMANAARSLGVQLTQEDGVGRAARLIDAFLRPWNDEAEDRPDPALPLPSTYASEGLALP